MEAMSIGDTPEENGEDLMFCVYVYNCQPGIYIDYSTGESRLQGSAPTTDGGKNENNSTDGGNGESADGSDTEGKEITYVLNMKSKKFHNPDCSGAKDILEQNKAETTKSRDVLMEEGYLPCGICKP